VGSDPFSIFLKEGGKSIWNNYCISSIDILRIKKITREEYDKRKAERLTPSCKKK